MSFLVNGRMTPAMAIANPRVHKSQYHHYIPRFLLRRFSYPSSTVLNHDKRRNRKQQADDVVTAVNLSHDIPKLVELPVGRIFGQFDMYKDDSAFSKKEQDRIETKLSAIEGQASRIIAKVADAYKAGRNEVSLSRYEKDLLRKFLFVMKYRSPIFYQRFNHQRAEDYNSNDRASFLEYMRERDFQRPLDVWFDNLLKIIDKPMDPSGDWTDDLFNHIYPGDAEWLFRNIRSMYLSFATPSDDGEEFLLTNNAFGIHEGPVDYSIDPSTGKQTTNAHIEFHVISVVSPHLVMILRHNLLPEPLDDQWENVRSQKETCLALEMQACTDPENATSLLHDLPVTKARNSYTTVHNGRPELAKGASGVPTASDKFHFTFFRLESKHVQTINLVMLDQAHTSPYIVFRSIIALRAAVNFYLNFPTQTRGMYSLKTITERPDDPTLLLLQKLEKMVHLMGSSVKARYYIHPLIKIKDTQSLDGVTIFDDVVAQVLKQVETGSSTTSLFALPTTVMRGVLLKLEIPISTITTIEVMTTADNLPYFPDLVFLAIRKIDPRSLSKRSKRILTIDLSTWRRGWDALVEQDWEIESAKFNRDMKFFENIRSNFVSRDAHQDSREVPFPWPGFCSKAEADPGWFGWIVHHAGDIAVSAFGVVAWYYLALLAWKLAVGLWSFAVETWSIAV